jgi:hypothetical protein
VLKEYIEHMSVLSATSIARVQTLTKQLSPAAELDPEFEGLSEDQRQDLATVQRLQRPLISGAQPAATYAGVPTLHLTVQEGAVGLGDGPRGGSQPDGSLASLVYAAHDLNDQDRVDSPVLDLLA